jgi:hypothetical protein
MTSPISGTSSRKCSTDGMRGTSPEPPEPKIAFVP